MSRRVPVWEKRMRTWKFPHKGETPLSELGLTIITAFCNDLHRFPHMFNIWRKYPDPIKDILHIMIIDDHSDQRVTEKVQERAGQLDFNISVYRIMDNLKWNTPGAWNLGFIEAPTEWAINLASDFALRTPDLERLLTLKPKDRCLYKFFRQRVTNNQFILDNWDRKCPHPEVFLMQKATHKDLHGFDEDFTGGNAIQREHQAQPYPGYGIFDNHFTQKVVMSGTHPYGVLRDGPIVTEYMEDTFGEEERENDHNAVHRNKIIWQEKMEGLSPEDGPMLRFKWEKMLEFQRRVAK